ncbi:HDOD domain-containing protein [methane-oxidizing endosymbiont of Gigantopelta aegis]|uniref:HDOD domain-containing protein n=1 Tax=methane-oxidizing endosymbiont of Gigantopelta aegis TaxID=2794938 RepID=UPI0018DB5FCE|nr:HDOD domain-containing protein [methane-oxidizing endosymbiont of Gigantopelta aegis]
MEILKSFFKDPKKSAPSQQVAQKISLEKLKKLIPIRNLNDDILQAFADENHSELIKANETLFTYNQPADSAIYLLEGTVTISDKNGFSHDIDSESTHSHFPLCSGKAYTTTAVAKTDVRILRVSHKIMSIDPQAKHNELIIPEHLKNNQILQLFSQHVSEEKLELPILPHVAVRLREAMQDDISIADAVKIIQVDPVITAKLIEVANCPLYLTLNPAKTCLDAVNRIGLNATRNLVISFSLRQVFSCQCKHIIKYMDYIWKESLLLSCLSFILAEDSKQLNPEQALLGGLVADIGSIPFLNFVAKLPKEFHNTDEVRQAIPAIRSVTGAIVLKNWNFDKEFIETAQFSHDWFYDHEGDLNLTDIVILSRLHYRLGQKKHASLLPPITSIPAASKLKNIALSPENTLHTLHNAKSRVREIFQAFNH